MGSYLDFVYKYVSPSFEVKEIKDIHELKSVIEKYGKVDVSQNEDSYFIDYDGFVIYFFKGDNEISFEFPEKYYDEYFDFLAYFCEKFCLDGLLILNVAVDYEPVIFVFDAEGNVLNPLYDPNIFTYLDELIWSKILKKKALYILKDIPDLPKEDLKVLLNISQATLYMNNKAAYLDEVHKLLHDLVYIHNKYDVKSFTYERVEQNKLDLAYGKIGLLNMLYYIEDLIEITQKVLISYQNKVLEKLIEDVPVLKEVWYGEK